MTTYRITAPHFCAAVIESSGFVTQAAPILRWAVGRPWPYCRYHCEKQGWTIEPLNDDKPIRFQVGDDIYELHWDGTNLSRITHVSESETEDIAYDDLPDEIKEML